MNLCKFFVVIFSTFISIVCYSQVPKRAISEQEPNDSVTTSTLISAFDGETIISGGIGSSNDIDHYKIEVPAGKKLSILFSGFNTIKRCVYYVWSSGIALDQKVRYENPFWDLDNSKTKWPAAWKNALRWYEDQCNDWKITKDDDGTIHFEAVSENCGIFMEGSTITPEGDGSIETTVIGNYYLTILDQNFSDVTSGFSNTTGGSLGVNSNGMMRDRIFIYSNITLNTNYFYVKIGKGDPRWLMSDYNFYVHID